MRIKILIIISIILAVSTFSCNKRETHWQTDVLLPIVSSEMGVGDIFGAENIASNPDQSVSIVVEEDIDLLNLDSVINIDDTIAVDIFNVPYTFTIPPGQKVIQKETSSKVNFGKMELVHAKAKRAKMKFYVTNSIKQPLLVKYELFCATKDGAIYEVEERVEAATATEHAYVEKEINLDSYDIDLSGPNKNSFNVIYAKTTVWIHPDGDTANVSPTDTVLIVSTFDEFVPEYAYGYLGTHNLVANASSAIKVFGNFSSGSFDLDNMSAYIDVYNFLGVDLTMEINDFATKNSNANTNISLIHSIIGSTLNMQRASESGIDDYPVYARNYKYDISNSNLDQMVEIMPDSLLVSVSGIINPLGNISAGNDFIYFDKGLDAKIKLDIPLNFSATDLLIEDYASINISDDGIKEGDFNILFKNGFPFDFNLQMYIVDNSNSIVDSLFDDATFIGGADVDGYGIVRNKKDTRLRMKFTNKLLESLQSNDKMLIRAKINSVDQKKYKLYQNYSLDIKMVGDFVYDI
ncbi:MAG: hypothetical protein KAG84_01875 [Bacteroidales bacterium]|nr:hypothetical protein [Bacteroidales bacterium]